MNEGKRRNTMIKKHEALEPWDDYAKERRKRLRRSDEKRKKKKY